MKDQTVIDFASKRAERQERAARSALAPKTGLVQAAPRKRPATRGYLSPPQTPPGGDAA